MCFKVFRILLKPDCSLWWGTTSVTEILIKHGEARKKNIAIS